MSWITFTLLIPANMLDTANKLAAAFDFDTGNDLVRILPAPP